jgi:arabinofuranosyltransferase
VTASGGRFALTLPRGAAFLTLLFCVVLVRTAWIGDDALISLRTVLNVTHGFGLTFNIAERVQTFTHPLWLFLITGAYVVLGNVYYATFALSFAASLAVFWLIVRGAASAAQAWLAAGLLLFSRAFVDYSTSGLENPLSHLLVAVALAVFVSPRREGPRLTTLALLASLLYLTRPDDALIVLPMLVAAAWTTRRPAAIVRAMAIGALPAMAWTVFSIIYYGFPFPNTAYAKLATGIPFDEQVRQGWLYLVDAADRDPLTMVTIGAAMIMAVVARSRAALLAAAGLALHLAYIVWIGGDFMGGRFLSVPFVAAVVALTRLDALAPGRPGLPWLPAYVALGAAAVASAQWPLASDSRVGGVEARRTGIVDERAVYFPTWSIVRADRRTFISPDWPVNDGVARTPYVLDTCGLMGASGLDWGPYAHLLDECALADPLLARLPAIWNDAWRPGHFRRMVPHGYRESLRSGKNELADRSLAEYYDQLRAVTRGPIWSADRLRTIGRLYRGVFDHLIDRTFYRYGGEVVRLPALSEVKPLGTARDAPGTQAITSALAILADTPPGRRQIEISVDSDDAYRLTFVRRNQTVGVRQFDPIPEYRRTPGLVTHTVDLPTGARENGFDTIVILPGGGDGKFGVGHLLVR